MRATASEYSLPAAAPPRDSALLVVDLDGLQRVNELHGRLAGDRVISAVAAQIVVLVHGWTVIIRSVGDEFLILAYGAEIERATALGERVRRSIAALPLSAGGRRVDITASVGVASAREIAASAPMVELVTLAKARLGDAKSSGKNRVCARGATERSP